jgi:hypothetical protein
MPRASPSPAARSWPRHRHIPRAHQTRASRVTVRAARQPARRRRAYPASRLGRGEQEHRSPPQAGTCLPQSSLASRSTVRRRARATGQISAPSLRRRPRRDTRCCHRHRRIQNCSTHGLRAAVDQLSPLPPPRSRAAVARWRLVAQQQLHRRHHCPIHPHLPAAERDSSSPPPVDGRTPVQHSHHRPSIQCMDPRRSGSGGGDVAVCSGERASPPGAETSRTVRALRAGQE